MKNSDYWRRRMEELEEAINREATQMYYEMEDTYRDAVNAIEKEIRAWYQRFASNNEMSMAEAKRLLNTRELEEFRWDVWQYIKKGETLPYSDEWAKALENASARIHVKRLDALQLRCQQHAEVFFGNQLDSVDGVLRKSYTEGYYRTLFEFQRGFNIGWDIGTIDERRLDLVLKKPWAADGKVFSERIWNDRKSLVGEMHKQLTQNVMLGKAPDDAIKAIAKRFNTSNYNAGRLVMTESAALAAVSQKQAYRELDVERYECVETLDSSTCATCAEMDGKVFDMSDYRPGETAPPFHPWCRGCTVPAFDDLGGERAARDKDGKTYYVPSDIKYPEWREIQERANAEDKKAHLPRTKADATLKETDGFVPAKTIAEADKYAKETLGITRAAYKGVDISVANEWNRGIADYFKKFPELRENFGFVGEAHERNIQMKPWLKQQYLRDLARKNPTVSIQALEPYAQQMLDKQMRAFQVPKSAYAMSLPSRFEKFKTFAGITVNRDWGKRPQDWLLGLAEDVEKKFHPVGCDTIKFVLDHEVAHQLDDILDISKMESVQKIFNVRTKQELTEELSTYAWKNSNKDKYREMVAEAWGEYCNNPEPREIASEIGKIIEQRYKEIYG